VILNPNCSEAVFKLKGSLDDLKHEVINMIKEMKVVILKGMDGKYKKHWEEKINEKIKEVKNIKKLSDFDYFLIPFSPNYTTSFSPLGNGELLVATCNNLDYDSVNKIPMDSDSYWDVAKISFYMIKSMGIKKDWIVVQTENEKEVILETKNKKIINDRTPLEMKTIGNSFYDIRSDQLLVKVTDKKRISGIKSEMLIQDI